MTAVLEQGRKNIPNSVTLIGALPPLKGNAYYCASLAKELSKKINVEFISFRKLYPEYLYPGGAIDLDPEFHIKETGTLSIRRLITYYNPFSWIRAGFAARKQHRASSVVEHAACPNLHSDSNRSQTP